MRGRVEVNGIMGNGHMETYPDKLRKLKICHYFCISAYSQCTGKRCTVMYNVILIEVPVLLSTKSDRCLFLSVHFWILNRQTRLKTLPSYKLRMETSTNRQTQLKASPSRKLLMWHEQMNRQTDTTDNIIFQLITPAGDNR